VQLLSDIPSAAWLIGLVAALIAGASKTGVPGIGILVAVLIPQVLPGREAVGATVPMLIFADCFAVLFYSKYTRWDKLTSMMPWVIAGMLIGAAVLFGLGGAAGDTGRAVNLLIGVVVLAMIALFAARMRFGARLDPSSRAWLAGTGIGAGVSTTVSNAAGPLMNMYMTGLGLDKTAFMGTTAWYFFIFNLVKIPLYAALDWLKPADRLFTPRGIAFSIALFPAIIIGVLIGRWLLNRVSQRMFSWITIIGATIGALRLIVMSL
jgi:uncharacterized protein